MAFIGVDFGSSYTTVAWHNPATGCAEAVCFNGDGSVKMPSTILYSNGGLIIGFQAQSYIEDVFKLPDDVKFDMLSNFIPSLKRILNPKAIEFIGDNEFTHKELLIEFFRHVIEQINDHCGKNFKLDGVSFSYPVEFEVSKIALIREAFKDLNVNVQSENTEPIAAVTGYLRNHQSSSEDTILVFDFGGGTIDVACVRCSESGMQLICEPKGSSTCGGQDIDQLIYDDLQKKVKTQIGVNISENGFIDYAVMNSCRKIKELFSGKNDFYEVAIPLVVGDKFHSFKYSLNRESFENIIYPKVYEAVSIAKNVRDNAKSNGYEVTKILLIGGSSKISLVTKLLSELFPQSPIETCGEKDIAVALGNLLLSSPKDKKNTQHMNSEQQELETNLKIDRNRSITCKSPSCGSVNCFKLTNEPGYICLDCGWKGKNVKIRF